MPSCALPRGGGTFLKAPVVAGIDSDVLGPAGPGVDVGDDAVFLFIAALLHDDLPVVLYDPQSL